MARKIIPLMTFALMLASIYAAQAIGVGGEGLRFGRVGATAGKSKGGGGGGSNFILMIDNTSRILQTDNASKICKAGGC